MSFGKHCLIALLGVVTICTYGSWYYSFGVLFDPILQDTGWSEAMLATSFSVGIALIGVGSIFGGRVLDRLGTRWVFAVAAIFGGVAFSIASGTDNALVFTVFAALGMGIFGAFGFYHVTMAAAVRVYPSDSTRAIAELTIWGALASPIFLPLARWLVEDYGWRTTSRFLVGSAVVALLAAAAVLPSAHAEGRETQLSMRAVVASVVETPQRRGFTAAVALVGIAISVILLYQVPVMVSVGLPLSTASFLAGFRGFCQLGGRLPLMPMVARVGSARAMLGAIAAIGSGGLLLAGSSSVVVGGLFAVTAGFGLGAYSPLQGMFAAELFDRASLGTTMGFYTGVSSLGGAVGPLLAGQIVSATGDRRFVTVLIVATTTTALVLLRPRGSAAEG